MEFQHVVVDAEPPGTENDVCLIADVNGDGHNDIVIGGKEGTGNVVWYEYPDWTRHTIGTARFEAGGVMMDITGNGRLDLVAGSDYGNEQLWWFENPGPPFEDWPLHLITSDYLKYHDQAAGDVDGDGEDELVVLSQQSEIVMYYDIPSPVPTGPWPEECRHTVWRGREVEGVAVADLDGDGENEIVAGPFWLKRENDEWVHRPVAPDYVLTCVALGDLNGDGRPEIVLSEGESDEGRLGWFSGCPRWEEHRLRDDLFHPHSLQVADMDGDGRPDIFVAEMGLGRNEDAELLVYLNRGNGRFEKEVVARGFATHHAKIGRIGESRLPSIVGKPYHPESRVDLWLRKD
ncbi:MAG: FG-GAP repeat domain-containing protein [Planctomycetota bacterium]